jgi:hypothetical protein
MKDTLITFETAKLAKEKGFNEIVSTAYGRIQESLYESNCTNRNSENIFLSAPTQSFLQKWLREVHEIHINISTFYFEDLEKYGYEVEDIIHKDGWIVLSNTAGTYEEALEIGLQEALKLI